MSVNTGDPAASKREAREADSEIDRALIERAQAGDTAAFRELLQRHQRRAYAIALALVKDEEEARDIVQEAFIRVFRGLSGFNGTSGFFTWLYRIVHNLSIDLIRKPSRRDTESLELADIEQTSAARAVRWDVPDAASTIERTELRQRIRQALDELPAYHRGVIVMRELEGMSYEEMAETMGVSKGTIMSRLFHARRKLQLALADSYVDAFGKLPDTDAGKEP
ncbi:MAG TPA: sigma-70 family RNA polymerase sigma factor [Polyangiaceae bacterium]|nr:sigma-70 family RNA polymerase sigma factor [Polyangiaceae bacterium]